VNDYGKATYGEGIADVYDDWYGGYSEQAIRTLAELARGGRVLELGIGTGRLALPLQALGLQVHGIEASPAMSEKLRAKPGGGAIGLTIGDFAEVAVEGRFALVFVAFNTFYSLLSQDDQVRCFENVARHLEPAGSFVVEAFVPDYGRPSGRQVMRLMKLREDEARLYLSLVDPSTQQVTAQHVTLSAHGVRLFPVKLRYAWPSELDLMARAAGLVLAHRWSSWHKDSYGPDSTKHISVYARAT
jgi:SAM-dependent methyltransferase